MKQKFLAIAEVIDAYRLIPRIILIGYGVIVWVVTFWFMGLDDPTATQMGFVNVIWGAAGIISGWYMSTGRKWDKDSHHIVRTPDYSHYQGPGPENDHRPNWDRRPW